MFPDMLKVELSSPGGGESGHCVNEVSRLGDGVYYNHNGNVTSQFRQLNNEVYTYSVPQGIRNQKSGEDGVHQRGVGRMPWSASTCHR